MARDRLTYRQRDLTAALKAHKAAGVSIARVEIRKDGVNIILGEPAAAPAAPEEKPDLTTILQERFSRHEKPTSAHTDEKVGNGLEREIDALVERTARCVKDKGRLCAEFYDLERELIALMETRAEYVLRPKHSRTPAERARHSASNRIFGALKRMGLEH